MALPRFLEMSVMKRNIILNPLSCHFLPFGTEMFGEKNVRVICQIRVSQTLSTTLIKQTLANENPNDNIFKYGKCSHIDN